MMQTRVFVLGIRDPLFRALDNEPLEFFGANKLLPKSNFLRGRNLESLTFLYRRHEICGLEHAVGRARIEPGKSATDSLRAQLRARQVSCVEVRYFELAASGWP
jgi:hypothetical protein